MIDINTNIEDHKLMQAMANALEISDSNLTSDKHGKFAIYGKDDKELKVIQHLDVAYFYYIQAPSKRRRTSIRNKLTSFGMSKVLETDTELYLSMKRLPEGDEAKEIRLLLGYKPSRSSESKKTDIPPSY